MDVRALCACSPGAVPSPLSRPQPLSQPQPRRSLHRTSLPHSRPGHHFHVACRHAPPALRAHPHRSSPPSRPFLSPAPPQPLRQSHIAHLEGVWRRGEEPSGGDWELFDKKKKKLENMADEWPGMYYDAFVAKEERE